MNGLTLILLLAPCNSIRFIRSYASGNSLINLHLRFPRALGYSHWQTLYFNINPLYFDGFPHTDTYIKMGLFVYKGYTSGKTTI